MTGYNLIVMGHLKLFRWRRSFLLTMKNQWGTIELKANKRDIAGSAHQTAISMSRSENPWNGCRKEIMTFSGYPGAAEALSRAHANHSNWAASQKQAMGETEFVLCRWLMNVSTAAAPSMQTCKAVRQGQEDLRFPGHIVSAHAYARVTRDLDLSN